MRKVPLFVQLKVNLKSISISTDITTTCIVDLRTED